MELGDLVDELFNELKRHDPELTWKDRRKTADVVKELFDNYITAHMFWTGGGREVENRYFTRMIDLITTKHPRPVTVIEDIYSQMDSVLEDVVHLPTWNVISVQVRGTAAHMELEEDYRITDWMNKNGHKYGFGEKKRSW